MKKVCCVGGVMVILVLGLLSLTACGGSSGGNILAGKGGNTICPLDGVHLDSADAHGDHVLVVSIDNGAGAEPQSGIGKADLLVEIPVEGGITRFMAFFYHSTPDEIGPVRSARHYAYDIINAYDAVFAHCGGSPQAYDVIRAGDVKDIDEMSNGDAFWRTEERKAPHNLYTSYEKLSEKSAEKEFSAVPLSECPSFNFMTEDDVEALTYGGVEKVLIPYRFKEVSFKWDEAAKRYQRYSASDPSVDAIDDSAVMADNVVVLYVENTLIGEDDSGRLDMDISSGEGILVQYGNSMQIHWTCEAGKGFVFTDISTSEEIKLIPGKTMIHIADPDTELAEMTKIPVATEGEE